MGMGNRAGSTGAYVFVAFLFRSACGPLHQRVRVEPRPFDPGRSADHAPHAGAVRAVVHHGARLAAVPFLAFGLLCAAAFGKVVFLAFIGRRCTPMLADDPVKHTVVGVAVAGRLCWWFTTIPFIGFVVYKLLGILGLALSCMRC